MSNSWFAPSNVPVTQSRGSSSTIRAEFVAIEAAFDKFPSPLQMWGGAPNYAVAGGAVNIWTVALAATYLVAYTDGMAVRVKFPDANTTTTPTVNLNALGAKQIVSEAGGDLVAGDIAAGSIHTLVYNSTYGKFQLFVGSVLASAQASASAAAASAAAAVVSAAAADADADGAHVDMLAAALSLANALIAQASSEAAATAAQGYRDTLLTLSGIYANIAAGLAATASGGYFGVPSAVTGESFIIYRDNAGTEVEVTRLPSATAYTNTLDATTKSTLLFGQKNSTLTYGNTGTPTTGSVSAFNGYTIVYAAPVSKDGEVTAVQFYATGAGTIKIKRFDSTFTQTASVTLTCAAGLNTFTTKDIGSFPVLTGEYLGFFTNVGYTTSSNATRSATYLGGLGDLTSPAHASLQSSTILYQAQIVVSYPPTQASAETLNSALVSRLRDEAKVTVRYGRQEDSFTDGTNVLTTGNVIFLDSIQRAGRITKFRAYMAGADFVTLYRWTRSGDTLTRSTNPIDIFRMPAGYSEIVLDLPVEIGDYLSVQSNSFRLSSASRFPGRGYIVTSGSSLVLDGTTSATFGNLPQLALEVDLNSYMGQVQKHRVSLGRTDSIALVGNSFGTGSYQPSKKTWLAIASQMSGWNFHNYSSSGATLAIALAAIRSATTDFYNNAGDGNAYGASGGGTSYRDYRNTYVLFILGQNEASSTALTNELHDCLETCRASGAIPILATEISNVVHHAAVYRQMAEQYGGVFIDLSQYLRMFPNTYAGFASTVHKNYRVAATLYATHLARALEATLGAPRSALKMYRPRTGYVYAVAADLMFDQGDDLRHGMSTKWQEIAIGGAFVLSGDANLAYMDTINSGSYSTTAQVYSEYLQAERGHALSFTDFALLEFHLDAQPQNCREVRVYVGTGHTAVYARSPYTDPYGTYSGAAYPTSGAQQGFWHSLPVSSDGWAIVREWELSGKVSAAGRIDFLVEHSGAFTLQNPRAEWWGESNRNRLPAVSLARPRGAELITTPAPYNAGALASGWTSSGSPTYANTANGGDLPSATTGYARLTSADTISFAITGITADPYCGREVEISVFASAERALINSATYPSGASMTGDSWDCEQLTIEHVNGSEAAKSSRTLMPYWQEVRVKTWLEATKTTVTVRLGCATTGAVLVARASCKLVDA